MAVGAHLPVNYGANLTWQMAGVGSRQDLLDAMIALLSNVVSCDSLGWNGLDVDHQRVEIYGNPPEIYQNNSLPPHLLLEAVDHPMSVSYLAEAAATPRVPVPRRMSDIISLSDLHRTAAYGILLKPIGASYQLTAADGRPTFTGATCWTFCRRTADFVDDELDRVQRLQPALIALSAVYLTGRSWVAADGDQERFNLTSREVQVLGVIDCGMTAHAAAYYLRISEKTVSKHLENIYRKLGCSDRVTALHRAHSAGLLPPR
ncbi:response regulator transcription factor [Diaminobutyricibacter sp. McL0618]|uniref:response regulator transcription factor n=1 Tax=Leifsonia sp. McL0618 TaxID=3415677 RepID=UPI003CF03BCB